MSVYPYEPADSFGGGLGEALIGNRPRRRGKGGKRGRGAPRKPPGMSIDQWAQQQAERVISAQVASIEAERQAYLDELRRQAEMRATQGRQLAEALQAMNFPGRIQGIYGNAASDIAGMAQGFSGQTRDIAAADAAQQMHMLSGSGQEGAVRNEGESMGNVVYGVGGFIPGRSLGEAGAAFAADAALQPGYAMQQAAVEAARLQEEGMGGLSDFARAIAEIRGEQPGLVQEFRSQREAMAADEYERRFEMLKWQADQHYRNYMLALERGDRKMAMKEYRLAIRKQRQAEQESNREYGLDVRRENRLQQETDADIANDKNPARKVTVAQARDSMKDVVAASDDIAKAVENAVRAGQWTPSAGRSKQRKALVNRIFRDFSHLALTPAAKARLKRIIMQAVTSAGRIGPQAPGAGASSGSGGGSSYGDYR